jgi:DNA mismatch endonuclease (patch repair protein)
MDKLTKAERSLLMARVKGTNTKPELVVRRTVHQMGFRYRLHSKVLPGAPDLVFAGRKKVIFVHGCFWHGHYCRAGRNTPKSNGSYWDAKLDNNKCRDRRNSLRLKRDGWGVLTVWECQIRELERLARLLKSFLETK